MLGARAQAEPARRVTLEWGADPGCVDGEALARTVEATLGRAVFHGDAPAAAAIEGEVRRAEKGFHARVVLRSLAGVLAERALDTPAASCDRLDESVAVVVALMVDSVSEPEPARAPEPPRPTPLRVAERPPRAPPMTGPSAGVSIDAGASMVAGLLPRVSVGLSARAAIELAGAWSIGAEGHAWSAQHAWDGAVGARVWAWAGALDACFAPARDRALRLGVCALLGGGATEATPIGLADPGRTRLPVGFVGAALDGAVHVGGPVWLHVRPNAWISFANPEYVYRDASGAQRRLTSASPVVFGLVLGLGVRSGS